MLLLQNYLEDGCHTYTVFFIYVFKMEEKNATTCTLHINPLH